MRKPSAGVVISPSVRDVSAGWFCSSQPTRFTLQGAYCKQICRRQGLGCEFSALHLPQSKRECLQIWQRQSCLFQED